MAMRAIGFGVPVGNRVLGQVPMLNIPTHVWFHPDHQANPPQSLIFSMRRSASMKLESSSGTALEVAGAGLPPPVCCCKLSRLGRPV